MPDYDPSAYWADLHQRGDLSAVGQSGLPASMNRWLYRVLERRVRWFVDRHALAPRTVYEVGAGTGYWVRWWKRRGAAVDGADPRRLSGIDLREESIAEARGRIPEAKLVVGDAARLPYPDSSFDMVYQATALSSMRARAMRTKVATEMRRVVRPGGLIVSYDFAWNPANRETVGINTRELRRLFAGMPMEVHRVTLVPPLARWLGDRSERALRIASRFAPLRSHRLALIDVPR